MPEAIARIIIEEGGGLSSVAGVGGGGTNLAGSLGSGSGGAKGGLLAAGALAGAVSAGVTTLISIAKKISDTLLKISPQLQSSVNVLKQSFALLLRPIADTINLFLRPYAISMLRFVVPIYKKWREFFGVEKNRENLKRDIPNLLSGPGGIVDVIGDRAKDKFEEEFGAGFSTEMFSLMMDPFDTFMGWMKDTDWSSVWSDFKSFFIKDLPSFSMLGLDPILNFFKDDLPAVSNVVFGSITRFFTEDLPQAWENYKIGFLKFWTEDVPKVFSPLLDKIKDGWSAVKTFFTDTVPSWITGSWDAVKTFFVETIPSWFDTLEEKISSVWTTIVSTISDSLSFLTSLFGGGGKETKVEDALITKKGDIVRLNPNDNVLAFQGNRPPDLGGGRSGDNKVNINVTINTLDPSSINSSVIDKIARELDLRMRRGLSSRFTESIGI